VETTYTLERWNRALKEVFDRALPATAADGRPASPEVAAPKQGLPLRAG
jgi:hypothetical protein